MCERIHYTKLQYIVLHYTTLLFKDDVSRSHYVASNGTMIMNTELGKDVEGSGSGNLEWHFDIKWRYSGEARKTCEDSRCYSESRTRRIANTSRKSYVVQHMGYLKVCKE
jgi:hypothetical protein